MSKKGMARPDRTKAHEKNTSPAVPEIAGKAKSGKEKANPIITDTEAPSQKVFHTTPFSEEKPVSDAYPEIDTDLGRDNMENDLTAADLQDN